MNVCVCVCVCALYEYFYYYYYCREGPIQGTNPMFVINFVMQGFYPDQLVNVCGTSWVVIIMDP